MYKPLREVTQDKSSVNDPSTPLLGFRKTSRQSTKICLCVIIFTIIMLVLLGVAGFLTYHFFFSSKSGKTNCIIPGVCNSKVLAYIDHNTDPCDDFFQYSCGRWLSANPLDGREEWGTFDELAINNFDHLRTYVTRPVRGSDVDAIKKSKYMYRACMNEQYIESKLLEHLQSFISSAGGWEILGFPTGGKWTLDNITGEHYLGSGAFFSFDVEPDDLNSSLPVIKVQQSGLTLGSAAKYKDSMETANLRYYIADTLKAVSVDGGDYAGIAQSIVSYEQFLAEYWLDDTELRNLSNLYNPMKLNDFSEIYKMDWVQYFSTFFDKAGISVGFTGKTVVIVETMKYFKNIGYDFKVTDVIVNYAKWQLLFNEMSYYSASLYGDYWDICRERRYPKSFKLGVADDFSCLELVEYFIPLAIARPFVEEFITDELRRKVNETANQIQKAFIQRVQQKGWLDQTTKDRCADKVNAITRQIAYPDFVKIDDELDKFYGKLEIDGSSDMFQVVAAIRNFQTLQKLSAYTKPIDKTTWLDPPTEVNAYYSPQFNQFVFLAGILRPPFIASNWPPFLQYGGLGVVVGHELTHGFDDQGQQYDKNGNRVTWWTANSSSNFHQRTQCFVDQYDQYSLLGIQINGQLTLGENIADNGGVHSAFHAYKNVMEGKEPQLYQGLSEDQLFFVAFAQLWCSEFTEDALRESASDVHSPGPIRVLGSLVNSDEFASTFNCPLGSKMYPSNDRCELW